MITYLNFGEEQNFCTEIKKDPENGDLTSLISYIQQDKCFNPINLEVLIPVNNTLSLNQTQTPGVIDTDELLQTSNDGNWKTSGEILFSIPDEEWMAENGQ